MLSHSFSHTSTWIFHSFGRASRCKFNYIIATRSSVWTKFLQASISVSLLPAWMTYSKHSLPQIKRNGKWTGKKLPVLQSFWDEHCTQKSDIQSNSDKFAPALIRSNPFLCVLASDFWWFLKRNGQMACDLKHQVAHPTALVPFPSFVAKASLAFLMPCKQARSFQYDMGSVDADAFLLDMHSRFSLDEFFWSNKGPLAAVLVQQQWPPLHPPNVDARLWLSQHLQTPSISQSEGLPPCMLSIVDSSTHGWQYQGLL